ncbi:MAG: ABC transporter substrate-binding protein [Prevotella sp.]|nr:ABC transporter substrate-binding protein [Prevotella sp.]
MMRSMKRKRYEWAVLLLSLLLVSCGGKKSTGGVNEVSYTGDSASLIRPQYAKGFTVKYLENGVRLVDVADPQKDEDKMPVSYQFALVPKGSDAETPEGYTKVEVPVERTIVMTMLQLSNFTALDAHDVVKGITGTKNLFNKDIRKRVKDGSIVKIGMEGNFDTELILAANPELIFISPFKRGGYDAIKETGITLVPHLGYKELDPLGQAEWVKFVGMFLGKEKEANECFKGIEQRYNDAKTLAAKASFRPTVFSGEMHGGNWYAVGGKNFLAQLFRDAGADYIVKNDDTGGSNIEFEQMYAMAANADYWRILNSYPDEFSYDALKASEPRNELFKAFKEKHVIYCNMKQTAYYESTPVEPDVVLKDLLAIFHPELVEKDYQPKYYQLLR